MAKIDEIDENVKLPENLGTETELDLVKDVDSTNGAEVVEGGNQEKAAPLAVGHVPVPGPGTGPVSGTGTGKKKVASK